MSGLFTFGLILVLGMALVAKVLLQHQIRDLEAAYYEQLEYQSQLREEWGQMLLESAHLTAPLLVEQQARSHLNMQKPLQRQFLVLTEEGAQ
ncbi:cell division protein FtsL [Thiomicrospira sp. ALE5]|uniref:cell division protein FtsL n=1 Tax=Thiomicrospira sp. ALE5 TaxID=748650 RepID=UPI001F18DF12|nr:cell division protein FtsL [Thiomicrospira sp. ALE5]